MMKLCTLVLKEMSSQRFLFTSYPLLLVMIFHLGNVWMSSEWEKKEMLNYLSKEP